MTLLKPLMVASLASLIAINVQAATEKSGSSKSAKTATTQQDSELKKFNEAVGIMPKARQFGQNEENQPMVVITFEVENRGKQPIKSLSWIGAFSYQQTVFFMQEMPINFEEPLTAGAKTDISVSMPLALFPEQAQGIMADLNVPIDILNVARNITFSNGTQINVKD